MALEMGLRTQDNTDWLAASLILCASILHASLGDSKQAQLLLSRLALRPLGYSEELQLLLNNLGLYLVKFWSVEVCEEAAETTDKPTSDFVNRGTIDYQEVTLYQRIASMLEARLPLNHGGGGSWRHMMSADASWARSFVEALLNWTEMGQA